MEFGNGCKRGVAGKTEFPKKEVIPPMWGTLSKQDKLLRDLLGQIEWEDEEGYELLYLNFGLLEDLQAAEDESEEDLLYGRRPRIRFGACAN